jgi:hypothetical protein
VVFVELLLGEDVMVIKVWNMAFFPDLVQLIDGRFSVGHVESLNYLSQKMF